MMRDTVRFETEPARPVWPRSPAGWAALVGMLFLIVAGGSMVWSMATAEPSAADTGIVKADTEAGGSALRIVF